MLVINVAGWRFEAFVENTRVEPTIRLATASLLSPEDESCRLAAIDFAKQNKKSIARRLTDPSIYISDRDPVSVFMAGSPGAGKTEASIELLEKYATGGARILRIDPDELRNEFPNYTGANSSLFQSGVSILVDRIHDLALDQNQSFVLDGTLSRHDVAKRNIERSLKRQRTVQILYVYQEPQLAWKFVLAREAAEGRQIRPEHFVEQYFEARNVVNALKREFGAQIRVELLLKNIDNSRRGYEANIDNIDHFVPEKYTREQVEEMIRKG